MPGPHPRELRDDVVAVAVAVARKGAAPIAGIAKDFGIIALAAGIGAVGLGVTLWYQLRADRYRPTTYWAVVAMVAVFGTMAADAIHVVLGVPYPITSTA